MSKGGNMRDSKKIFYFSNTQILYTLKMAPSI